jgi:hypothetical protein
VIQATALASGQVDVDGRRSWQEGSTAKAKLPRLRATPGPKDDDPKKVEMKRPIRATSSLTFGHRNRMSCSGENGFR